MFVLNFSKEDGKKFDTVDGLLNTNSIFTHKSISAVLSQLAISIENYIIDFIGKHNFDKNSVITINKDDVSKFDNLNTKINNYKYVAVYRDDLIEPLTDTYRFVKIVYIYKQKEVGWFRSVKQPVIDCVYYITAVLEKNNDEIISLQEKLDQLKIMKKSIEIKKETGILNQLSTFDMSSLKHIETPEVVLKKEEESDLEFKNILKSLRKTSTDYNDTSKTIVEIAIGTTVEIIDDKFPKLENDEFDEEYDNICKYDDEDDDECDEDCDGKYDDEEYIDECDGKYDDEYDDECDNCDDSCDYCINNEPIQCVDGVLAQKFINDSKSQEKYINDINAELNKINNKQECGNFIKEFNYYSMNTHCCSNSYYTIRSPSNDKMLKQNSSEHLKLNSAEHLKLNSAEHLKQKSNDIKTNINTNVKRIDIKTDLPPIITYTNKSTKKPIISNGVVKPSQIVNKCDYDHYKSQKKFIDHLLKDNESTNKYTAARNKLFQPAKYKNGKKNN